jgi:TPR repeat protein
MLTGQTVSAAVLSGARALMKTSNAQFGIIERPRISLIRTEYITLGVVLNMGKGIGQDFIRATKYYHLAAEFNNADAQNSFGICLERGIGVQSNLADQIYRSSL